MADPRYEYDMSLSRYHSPEARAERDRKKKLALRGQAAKNARNRVRARLDSAKREAANGGTRTFFYLARALTAIMEIRQQTNHEALVTEHLVDALSFPQHDPAPLIDEALKNLKKDD